MIVDRETLLNQIEAVQPGVSPKGIIHQSDCVIFKNGRIATYNDLVACFFKTELDLHGAVKADKLLQLLGKLKEDEIEVRQDEGKLIVEGKGRRAWIYMENEIHLPVGKVEKPKEWKPLHEDFCEGMDIVAQCASTDQNKFVITCVHITPEYVEATDNVQAARCPMQTGFNQEVMVRADSMKQVAEAEVTEYSLGENWIHFRNPSGLRLSCRTVTGYVYPKIGKLLKATGQKTVLPKGLSDEAANAEIFSQENPDQNHILVRLKSGKIQLKGEGASGGYIVGPKKITYKGPDMKFLIAPKLLAQLVQQHNEAEIGENVMKVNTGKCIFVTCLGKVD